MLGDPYCEHHGFNPCHCGYNKMTITPDFSTLLNFYTVINCSQCGKHPSVCMCKGSSDPHNDIRQYQGTLPDDVPLSVDITQPQEEKPVKKWADECRETAKRVNAQPSSPEPKSLYIFMLERCKTACTVGQMVKIFFWKKDLPIWSQQEIYLAADLLRGDNFKVETYSLEGDIRIHISWE